MAEDQNNESKKQSESDEGSLKETFTEKTGFEPSEILKAPIKSPELEKAKKPTEVQTTVFGVGVLIIVIGAILWAVIGFWAGMIVGFIGVGVAATGIMVRFDTSS